MIIREWTLLCKFTTSTTLRKTSFAASADHFTGSARTKYSFEITYTSAGKKIIEFDLLSSVAKYQQRTYFLLILFMRKVTAEMLMKLIGFFTIIISSLFALVVFKY